MDEDGVYVCSAAVVIGLLQPGDPPVTLGLFSFLRSGPCEFHLGRVESGQYPTRSNFQAIWTDRRV